MTALVRVAALGAAVVAAIAVLYHLAGVPDADMSASRVVPAVALARGFPIYAGADGGPIIDFMYGPVAALAFLPAALATTPSGALAIAALLNAVFFFGPIAWLHARTAGRRDLAFAGVVLFTLAVLRDPGLLFSALTIHADAPALGLGALACALVTTSPTAAAVATVLAIAAKQTMAPLAVALLAVVAVRDGTGAAVRFAIRMVVLGVVAATAALVAFGPTSLVFNMLTLPSRMPWYGEATRGGWGAAGFPSGRLGTAGFTAGLLGRLAWLPALVVAGLAVGARRRHVALASQPATVFAIAAVALAPIAIVSAAKVGGFFNTFSVCTYFLVAAATAGLACAAGGDDRGAQLARAVLLVGLVLGAADLARSPAGVRSVGPTIARLRAWDDNPQQHAYRAALAHPGEIDFPWNPLATLLAEGRLDNNEIGAWNRDLAGVPIPKALWRRWLPPRMRLLAFRPPTGAFAWLPEPTGRVPEYTEPTSLPGLAGWTVLAPVASAGPSRQEGGPR